MPPQIPLNLATNNSSSVSALGKNQKSSPSDYIKKMEDFQQNFQTVAPNHNNSHSTEDLVDFSKTSLSLKTNASHIEDPANYSCPSEFSITQKLVTYCAKNQQKPSFQRS